MGRDYKRDAERMKHTYKRFTYSARRDSGEANQLEAALTKAGLSFTDWVRKHVDSDLKQK